MKTIDEVIDELTHTTGISFASKKKYDKAVIKLDLMPDVMYYLREYRDLVNRPRNQRLIEILRDVRGRK